VAQSETPVRFQHHRKRKHGYDAQASYSAFAHAAHIDGIPKFFLPRPIKIASPTMRIHISKFTLVTVAAACLFGGTVSAYAQEAASAPMTQDTKAAAKAAKTQARKDARAKRKAERKAARAKNSAELKKLEDAGYNPATNNPNYPQNLQDAQKKAAGAAGASQ
jgi:hypothetical protein